MALLQQTLALMALASLPAFVCADLPNGFVTAAPTSHRQARGANASNWNNPAWQAIQANITSQLRDVPQSFARFRAHRGRRYRNSTAETQAQAHFHQNLKYIAAENAKGTNPYVLGVTNFTDLSYEQFAASYLMKESALPDSAQILNSKRRSLLQTNNATATTSCGVYWGANSSNPLGKNVVSPVKNQGACGSCWAFAAAAQVESWRAMQNSTLDGANFMDLSEQMLTDCTYGTTVNGCQGGWPTDPWDWIISNGGSPSEAARPYTSGSSGVGNFSCPAATTPRTLGSLVIKSYSQVTPANDAGLVAALQRQPVVTAVSAGPEFQNYVGGAISCSTSSLNHAVQTVGCGYIPSANGTTYLPVYVIKNQWSSFWGYAGFAYLLRTQASGGNCGLASAAYTVAA